MFDFWRSKVKGQGWFAERLKNMFLVISRLLVDILGCNGPKIFGKEGLLCQGSFDALFDLWKPSGRNWELGVTQYTDYIYDDSSS